MLGDDWSKLHMNDLCPEIMLPVDDAPLKQITHLLDVCMKHNFVPALIALGATVMAFHYSSVVEMYGGCPIPILHGPSETGKTPAIMFGSCNMAHYTM